MYQQHFGLDTLPFQMTPDSGMLMLTPQHREALASVSYAIVGRKGFAVLTGEAGTGKTTVLTRALRLSSSRIQLCMILNPLLTPAEFLEAVLLDLGVRDIPASKARRLLILQGLLVETDKQSRITALVIDEAHLLTPALLEEIRLFGNFEMVNRKLLQIVLVGQPGLTDVLNQPDLFQLKQRVAVRCSLNPLTAAQVVQYIRFRWEKSGGGMSLPFTCEAVSRIAAGSGGIPRLVNSICDSALIAALGNGSRSVTEAHVRQVCVDMDLNAGFAANTVSVPVSEPAVALQPVGPVLPDQGELRTLTRYLPDRKQTFLSRRWPGGRRWRNEQCI